MIANLQIILNSFHNNVLVICVTHISKCSEEIWQERQLRHSEGGSLWQWRLQTKANKKFLLKPQWEKRCEHVWGRGMRKTETTANFLPALCRLMLLWPMAQRLQHTLASCERCCENVAVQPGKINFFWFEDDAALVSPLEWNQKPRDCMCFVWSGHLLTVFPPSRSLSFSLSRSRPPVPWLLRRSWASWIAWVTTSPSPRKPEGQGGREQVLGTR